MNKEVVFIAILFVVLIAAMITDFYSDRIPNELCISGTLAGMMYQFWKQGLDGIIQSFVGILLPVVILFLLFRIGALGAGDVKLFAVTGAFLGIRGVIDCLGLAFLVGAVLALMKMCYYGNYLTRMQYFAGYVVKTLQSGVITRYEHASEPGGRIRFSLPILMSVFLYWIGG